MANAHQLGERRVVVCDRTACASKDKGQQLYDFDEDNLHLDEGESMESTDQADRHCSALSSGPGVGLGARC
jgi:hypothetical protein